MKYRPFFANSAFSSALWGYFVVVEGIVAYKVYQWRIQLWADRAVAPPPPSHWPKQYLGLVMAARVRHGGKFSLKSLTFGRFLYKNVQKAFSITGASPPDPHQGLSAPRPRWGLWGPARGSAPDPRLGCSRSARSPWSPHPLDKSWIRHWGLSRQI